MAKPARKKSAARSKPNAVALLRADHEAVSVLFDRYEKGKNRLKPEQKANLAKTICDNLSVHAQIEEEIFYPACHQQVRDSEDLLAEAKVEHGSLKELIARIGNARPGEDAFDACVKVLGEYVKHHVKEEQSELFPKVRSSDLDLQAVGAQLAERKAELTRSPDKAGR